MYKNWANFVEKTKDFLEFYMEAISKSKLLANKIIERSP